MDEQKGVITSDSWESIKKQHIELSDAAAEKYDEIYGDANYATKAYMDYEVEIIKDVMGRISNKSLALDLGCGTGRDSEVLAREFPAVTGYDFSKEMVRVANTKKIRANMGNVRFEARDIEVMSLPQENDTVDMVNTAFGMGSFLKKPENLFREIRRVLFPQGYAIFSFYNAQSYSTALPLQWSPALAARVIPGKDMLSVNFEGRIFEIPARAYSPDQVAKMLGEYFEVDEITTFPSLSALMPQELFQDHLARKLCGEVDKYLASNNEIAAGPYIVAICHKRGPRKTVAEKQGYHRALNLILEHKLENNIVRHEPLTNMQEVKETIGKKLQVSTVNMLKSLLIAHREPDDHDSKPPRMWVLVVQADRKIDGKKVSKILGLHAKKIGFVKRSDVEDFTGFKVGAIPPFGHPKSIPVIVDTPIGNLREVWCGTGEPGQSIRLTVTNLENMTNCVYRDIGKDDE